MSIFLLISFIYYRKADKQRKTALMFLRNIFSWRQIYRPSNSSANQLRWANFSRIIYITLIKNIYIGIAEDFLGFSSLQITHSIFSFVLIEETFAAQQGRNHQWNCPSRHQSCKSSWCQTGPCLADDLPTAEDVMYPAPAAPAAPAQKWEYQIALTSWEPVHS